MMMALVHVTIKPTVLDPQGQTIRASLNGLGYKEIADVRQGKFFEIRLADDAVREEAVRRIEQIAQEVLANPVIEEYRVEIVD
jgi:phosphoribosylformylglycinamidine synthase PurS subunit